jgi:methyl-accepting chemotaxis protein
MINNNLFFRQETSCRMLNNLSLKLRLALLCLVSALGIAVLALSAIWSAYSSKAVLLDFVDQKIALSRSANASYADGLQMGQALRNILLDPDNKKAYVNFSQASAGFSIEFQRLSTLLSGSASAETSAQLQQHVARWQPWQPQILDLIHAGNGAAAKTMLVGQETPAWRAVRADLLQVVKQAEIQASQERAQLLAELEWARDMAIVLSLISFCLVSVITLLVARGIFQQVGGEPAYAAASLQQIARGDLRQSVRVMHGDEQSVIAAMSRMQLQIKQLIAATASSADAVVHESDIINSEAVQLADTAQQQSMATSAIASAVQQLSASIVLLAENANQARKLSLHSQSLSHDSLTRVTAATNTIEQVAGGMEQAVSSMEQLSMQVGSIDSIVRTIREIADQTNLLALNAAIEAARAGEQGRGFAVVSDEVRKLAERTTRSTQEIAQIVSGVATATDAVKSAMTQARELAQQGSAHTAEVHGAMMEVSSASAAVSEAIATIAGALHEQTGTSRDISQRAEAIASGISQTYAASAESKSHATVLVDLSLALKASVRQFNW